MWYALLALIGVWTSAVVTVLFVNFGSFTIGVCSAVTISITIYIGFACICAGNSTFSDIL